MWSFTKSFLLSLQRPVFVCLFTLSLTLQLAFAGVFYYFEKELNTRIEAFFDAFYFTVTVVTGVGLGDIYPVTQAGKALSILMMLSGTAIFVSFTAVLAVSILEVEMKHSKES